MVKQIEHERTLKDDWHVRGFSFGTMEDHPGQQWNDFRHSVDELVSVLSGELTVIVSGEESLLAVGDEAFIPANALHSVRNNGDVNCVWAFGYQTA